MATVSNIKLPTKYSFENRDYKPVILTFIPGLGNTNNEELRTVLGSSGVNAVNSDYYTQTNYGFYTGVKPKFSVTDTSVGISNPEKCITGTNQETLIYKTWGGIEDGKDIWNYFVTNETYNVSIKRHSVDTLATDKIKVSFNSDSGEKDLSWFNGEGLVVSGDNLVLKLPILEDSISKIEVRSNRLYSNYEKVSNRLTEKDDYVAITSSEGENFVECGKDAKLDSLVDFSEFSATIKGVTYYFSMNGSSIDGIYLSSESNTHIPDNNLIKSTSNGKYELKKNVNADPRIPDIVNIYNLNGPSSGNKFKKLDSNANIIIYDDGTKKILIGSLPDTPIPVPLTKSVVTDNTQTENTLTEQPIIVTDD